MNPLLAWRVIKPPLAMHSVGRQTFAFTPPGKPGIDSSYRWGHTAGEITPLQAAKLAAEEGIKIYSIGMGAEEMIQPGIFGTSFGARRINPSEDLDEKTLSDMASLTGGRYFRAKNTEELQDIYALLDELEPVQQAKETFRPSIALYFWPLLLAVLLSVL